MHLKTLLILFSAVSLIACSSTPKPMAQAAPNSSAMGSIQKGFSLSFPTQNEWAVVKNDPYKMVMTKQGLAKDERYTIQALVVKLPKFKSDEDFMKFITNRMEQSQKQSGVKVIEQHAEFVEGQDNKCVQYNSKEEYPGKSKSMVLEVVNFTCRHTDKENAGVYLAYSKKYPEGSDDKNFSLNAQGIFSYMELAAF